MSPTISAAIDNKISCWIEPDGRVHPVRYAGHADFARDYLNDETADETDLERRRWMHVSGGSTFMRGAHSQAQLDKLMDLLMAAEAVDPAMFADDVDAQWFSCCVGYLQNSIRRFCAA